MAQQKINAEKFIEFFWKTIDDFDIDKYIGKYSSIGGSAQINVRQQAVRDIKEMQKIVGNKVNFLEMQYKTLKEMGDKKTLSWLKRSVKLYYN